MGLRFMRMVTAVERRTPTEPNKKMKIITDAAEIQAALESFVPNKEGADATNRVLPGASSAFDPQEWLERGTINGEPAQVFYVFDEEDVTSEDAEDYPWDTSIDRIIIGAN